MEANLVIDLTVEGFQVGEVQAMAVVVLAVEGLQVGGFQAMVPTGVGRVKQHRLASGSVKPMVAGFYLFQQTFLAVLSFPFFEFFFQGGRFLLRFQTSL